MKQQNEREELQSDFAISHCWWPCPFNIFLSLQWKPKKTSKLPHNSCWRTKVQDFTPTVRECSGQLLSSNWTHLMNKYIFLVVISKEKSKTNRDQDFCVGKLENANQSSVAFKSENENFAMLSSSTRKTRHVFQTLTLTNGDKLNDCVKKIKSTKGETNKEDGKKETGLN